MATKRVDDLIYNRKKGNEVAGWLNIWDKPARRPGCVGAFQNLDRRMPGVQAARRAKTRHDQEIGDKPPPAARENNCGCETPKMGFAPRASSEEDHQSRN